MDLSVLVDERGNVVEARVVSPGAGRAGLSEAAADYARKWKYRPATKDGVPVKVWKPVTVVFKLPLVGPPGPRGFDLRAGSRAGFPP